MLSISIFSVSKIPQKESKPQITQKSFATGRYKLTNYTPKKMTANELRKRLEGFDFPEKTIVEIIKLQQIKEKYLHDNCT